MGKIKNYMNDKQRERCGIFQKKRFKEENLAKHCGNKFNPEFLHYTCKGSGYLSSDKKKMRGIVKTDYHPEFNYIRAYCIKCPYYKYSLNNTASEKGE